MIVRTLEISKAIVKVANNFPQSAETILDYISNLEKEVAYLEGRLHPGKGVFNTNEYPVPTIPITF